MSQQSRPLPRVLSLPEDHAYVDRAFPPGAVVAAPVTRAEARGWQTHPAFDPAWLRDNRADFDLVHLHFGFDALTPRQLHAWVNALHRLELPLVLTVHDLRNPHHATADRHDSHLQILLTAADALITLTAGAAAEIFLRAGRAATVIPHPPVLLDPPPRAGAGPVVGVVVKNRAQVVEPDRLLMAVKRGAEEAGARLRVDAHPARIADLPAVSAAAAAGELDLRIRERFTDAEFASYLTGLRASVLPYRFGSHSGWLEACRDAGTRVVAPDCGYFAEQWDEVVSYSHDEQWGLDEDSLAVAVATAVRAPAPGKGTCPSVRIAAVNRAHRDVWDVVLSAAPLGVV